MNEKEAIDIIKQVPLYRYECELEKGRQSELFETLEMSIKALEEVQQLRNEMWELNQICRDYTSLGTVEELKEAKEKQIAKKLKKADVGYTIYGCPNCDYTEHFWSLKKRDKHCPNCGQKLDWGNEDAE